MKSKNKNKRFEAIYRDDWKNNHLIKGKTSLTEVRFDIIATDVERAKELISSEGEDPTEFIVYEVPGNVDQLGRQYPECIQDARIK